MGFEQIRERWHIIDPYKEYAVTESGKVYSYRQSKTGWQGLRELSQRGLRNHARYLTVCISKGVKNDLEYKQIHRLVATYFCDGFFEGAVVNHIDGNIHNNHFSNLEWVTQRENINKSYITSGIDAVRNFSCFELRSPCGKALNVFRGRNAAKTYILENNLDTSFLSLARYGGSRGYTLLKTTDNNALTTIR